MCNYFLKIKAENPCTCCFHMFIGIVREGGHIYENRSIMLSLIQTCLTGVVLFFSFLRNAACHVFFCCTHENNTQQTEGEEGEGRREKQRNNQRTCLKAKLFIWIFPLKNNPVKKHISSANVKLGFLIWTTDLFWPQTDVRTFVCWFLTAATTHKQMNMLL